MVKYRLKRLIGYYKGQLLEYNLTNRTLQELNAVSGGSREGASKRFAPSPSPEGHIFTVLQASSIFEHICIRHCV